MSSLSLPHDNKRYMDRGASSHISYNPSNMQNLSDSSFYHKNIVVGNGSNIPILGQGSSPYPTASFPCKLNQILYSPSIVKNILSVRKFTHVNNISFEFDPCGFSVKGLGTGITLTRCNSHGDLYPFQTEASPYLLAAISPTIVTGTLGKGTEKPRIQVEGRKV